MKNKFLIAVSAATMISNVSPASLIAAEETVQQPALKTSSTTPQKTENDSSLKMEELKNNVENAQKEVLNAQAELDAIDARLEEAQNEVDSKNSFVETIDLEKEEIAKNADTESNRLLAQASKEYRELNESLTNAKDKYDSLKEEQDQVDLEYQKAVEASKQAEAELEEAKKNYNSLNKDDLDAYEAKKGELESQIYFINESIEEANQKLQQLEAEKNQANLAVNTASERYQEQSTLYAQAQQNLNAASQEVSVQQALVSSLEDPDAAANAQVQLQQAQSALSKAQEAFNQQQAQVNAAQAAYNEASNKAASAEANYNSVVENELNPAKEQRQKFLQAVANINDQIEADKALIGSIEKDKEAVNSKIAEAKKKAEDSKAQEELLKQEAEKLQKEITEQKELIQNYENQIQEKKEAHAKGSLGFFEAINDSDAANIITNGLYSSYVNLGDENDATNLENMRASLKIIQDSNTLRIQDKLPEFKVSNILMALSQTRADWNKVNAFGHAKDLLNGAVGITYIGENIAINTDLKANLNAENNPFQLWYRDEKKVFEDHGGSYSDDYVTTGHYESLIDPEFNVSGAAYIPKYQYQGSYFNRPFDLQMFGTTQTECLSVEDYIKQFDEYYNSISEDSIQELEAKKAEVQQKLTENQNLLNDLQNVQIPNEQKIQNEAAETIKNSETELTDLDTRIETIQNNNKNLETLAANKQMEADNQNKTITELQNKANDALAAYEKANQLSSEAAEKLNQEKMALQEANLEVSKAENLVKEKQTILDNLDKDKNEAVQKLNELIQKKDEAAKKAEEEKNKLDTANEALKEASKNAADLLAQIQTINEAILEDKDKMDAASKELDDLNAQNEAISQAAEALENAQSKFDQLSANADEVLEKLINCGDEVFEAKNTLDERQAYFDEAEEALKEVEKAVGVWKNVRSGGSNSIVINRARMSIEDVPSYTEDYTTLDTKFSSLSSIIEAYKRQREMLEEALKDFTAANDYALEINDEWHAKKDEVANLEAKLDASKKALEDFILSLDENQGTSNTPSKPKPSSKPNTSDKDKVSNIKTDKNQNVKQPAVSKNSSKNKSNANNSNSSVSTSAYIESTQKHTAGLIASLGLVGILAKKRKENE